MTTSVEADHSGADHGSTHHPEINPRGAVRCRTNSDGTGPTVVGPATSGCSDRANPGRFGVIGRTMIELP